MPDMAVVSFWVSGWTTDELKKTTCPREWTLSFRDSQQGWRGAVQGN